TGGGTRNAGTGGIILTDSGSNSSSAELNINGGLVDSGRNVAEGTNKTGLSTLVLNGGTLNMNGFAIGSGSTAATGAIDTLTLQSGTLKNVGQINAGLGLVKANTADTLILDGNN